MRAMTSVQNPCIRALRALRERKGREAAGCFLAEGKKLCAEALRDARVETVLVAQSKLEAYRPLLAGVRDVIAAPEHVLAAVAETKTPQGIVASVRFPPMLDLEAAHGALLVLDGVQDPGNVGTMLRTAEASGFSGALLSTDSADAFAPKTVRATMGSIFRLPLWRGALEEALAYLKGRGFTLISSELGGMPFVRYGPAQLPLALIIGSEGQGVRAAVSRLADVRVALPMRGRAESLNAAVAAGVMMYGLMENTVNP